MIPGSGGEAPYLERGFGRWATFIFNWTSIMLLKPGGDAIIAVAFAKYVMMMFMSGRLMDGETANELLIRYKWGVKGIALGCILAVTALSSLSRSISRRTQFGLTIIKLFALAFVIFGGFIYMFGNPTYAKENLGKPFEGTIWSVSLYASAFNHGLWAFEGWNNLNLVAGDLKRPSKNLPLAIWTSVCMVIILYILTLLGYFFTLPESVITSTETIGIDFGQSILGRAGGIVMALLISICIFGACLSGMATSAEIVVYAAQIGHIPSIFARINGTLMTALNAYLMQCVLAMAMVLASDFNALVHIYTFPAWIFYGGSVASLLILRWREPEAERPYKVWITTPIIFLIACVILICSSFWAQPLPIGLSLIVLLAGLPFYYFFVRDQACCPIRRRASSIPLPPDTTEMAEVTEEKLD